MADPQSFTVDRYDRGYSVIVDSEKMEGLEVNVDVSLPEGVEPSDEQVDVVLEYAGNMENFIRKNFDYGDSFATGPKIESLLKYGEIREDELPRLIAKQIFVRGFLDKLSRFYQLYLDDNDATVDESVEDTLFDMANYALMLTSQLRRYGYE